MTDARLAEIEARLDPSDGTDESVNYSIRDRDVRDLIAALRRERAAVCAGVEEVLKEWWALRKQRDTLTSDWDDVEDALDRLVTVAAQRPGDVA